MTKLLVLLIQKLFRKLYPMQIPSGYENVSAADLKPRIAKYNKQQGILLFPLFLFSGWVWYEIFVLWSRYLASHRTAAQFQIITDEPFYLLPVIFPAVITTMEVLRILMKIQMKERFPDLQVHADLQAGYDTRKARQSMYLVFGGVSLWLAVSFLYSYTLITNDSLITNRFSTFKEARHTYNEIQSIHSAIDETSQPKRRYYQVSFRDGFNWTTIDFPYPYSPRDVEIVDFLIARSGKTVE